MRFTEAVGKAGITYRQGDWWRSRGWVVASTEGSGTTSEITATEALILCRMAALVDVGMRPPRAAEIARFSVGQGTRTVDLCGGLRLVFDVVRA